MEWRNIGIRWTVGKVSAAGFEALRLAVWSAWHLFGEAAEYVICVNTIPVDCARAKTGDLPRAVQWHDVSDETPAWMKEYIDPEMAQGVAWKFAPVRVFPERYEISFDNDVILWEVPRAMESWLGCGDSQACLLAEDVERCLGQFSNMGDSRAVNSGIRGLPPGYNLDQRLREVLTAQNVILFSELDEQGLQAVALSQSQLFLVSTEDVSICSPFPMHQHAFGKCGVHFVGLNADWLPWSLNGRWAHEAVQEQWSNRAEELHARVWRRTLPMPQ
jgi:hypothetical protein